MKNISLALNGVLIIAVAILYYLHFSSKTESSNTVPTERLEKVDPVPTKNMEEITSNIGYINVDSLQGNYKLYEEMINKLKVKQKKYEREITTKSSAFEKRVQEFQKNASTMTQFEGQLKQKELGEEEQRLYKMRDDFSAQFKNEEAKLNDQFQKKVKSYIEELNKSVNFDIIIGASQLGNLVLDHQKKIDITQTVIDGLNEQYEIENKKK